ncbi:hypothetical protein lerEdw1_011325 [Lerista edwardsae]|nr:hypothetical protein lerEdw1_011325 [Lerista edwardsae]
MDAREARGGGSGGMESRFRRSSLRFACAMSSIVEKYNFPFDNDMIVSIKTLTYETPDGPKVWGEEENNAMTNCSYQSTVQCQENAELSDFNEETQQQQTSDFENEDYEDYQSAEEEQFTNSYGENQLESPDHKSHNELVSIKKNLENVHIKETPTKNKCRVEMDILLEEGAMSVPKLLKVTRTKPQNFLQGSPMQVLGGESLFDPHSVVLRKEVQSTDGHPALQSLRLYNTADSFLTPVTTVSGNQSLWSDNETANSSFLEMYESANEQCSWNNVTIADLYPGMVKALSRLMHKASHKASSSSLIKRYRHGYWQPKLGCLNTTTDRIRKFRPLKTKNSSIVTKNDRKKGKLHMANNSPLDDGNPQVQCSVDRMEIDPSETAEDGSCAKRIGAHAMETIIFPTEETFVVKHLSCIPSSSDCIRKGQSSEKNSSAICVVDPGSTLLPADEDKTREMNTLTVEATSCLSLSYNSSTSSYLQNIKTSPVTTSNRFLGNHEIKIFSTAISLQRSHSLSSLPVNQSPIKARQKCDTEFEKMYKELCSPNVQKRLALPNIYASPRKSDCKSHSSKFHLKSNETFDNIYQKLCSGRLPKIPTLLRAANLKKYERIQMSETVNALVNSPVRTLPAVARIKRAANFCNEDVQSSPIKRLKNITENSPRICQKPAYWKKMNLQKTDMTFTLHTPHLMQRFRTPVVDAPVAAIGSSSVLPVDSDGLPRDPVDRRIEQAVRRAFDAAAGSLRASVAGSMFSRAVFLWIRELLADFDVPAEPLSPGSSASPSKEGSSSVRRCSLFLWNPRARKEYFLPGRGPPDNSPDRHRSFFVVTDPLSEEPDPQVAPAPRALTLRVPEGPGRGSLPFVPVNYCIQLFTVEVNAAVGGHGAASRELAFIHF